MSRKCFLLNLTSKSKIFLSHNETKIIGRNAETGIQDKFISKRQLECNVNLEQLKVNLKCIGQATCGIDGYAMVKNKNYLVGHGHRIELRLGFHEFEIVFDPPPDSEDSPLTKKWKPDLLQEVSASGNNKTIHIFWKDVDRKELHIYTSENCLPKAKVAAFDIDGTIITTKSGSKFPKDKDDWQLLFTDIPEQLKKLHALDFKIVFFTNQLGIGKDPYKIKNFQKKVENIAGRLSVPVQVFIATGRSIYRKPAPGMWNSLVEKKNKEVKINLDESFYVGDAAGREKNWAVKKPKDHSIADRLFALNLGLKFYTPEEYFLKARKVSFLMPEFDPRSLSSSSYPSIEFSDPNLIIMVGPPGSGKSHFCHKVLIPKKYIHINRDTVGSWQKCVNILEDGLKNFKKCVVDNTNPDKESRSRFIKVAKQFNVACYCCVMSTDIKQAKHNNKFRELTDKTHIPVSEIIINSYKGKYQEPELSEGFAEIFKIPFVPQFVDKQQEQLYKMFLLEK